MDGSSLGHDSYRALLIILLKRVWACEQTSFKHDEIKLHKIKQRITANSLGQGSSFCSKFNGLEQ